MQGDERMRFCRHCAKNVYNFSAMTAAEAALLIREKEGKLCGRFYQRADGTMLTADCPVGAARYWRQVKTLAGAAVATLVMTFGSISLARQTEEESQALERSRLARFREEAVDRVKGWLGIRKPVMPLLGDVCISGKIALPLPPPGTNAPPQK
jgi:hypothetical protein